MAEQYSAEERTEPASAKRRSEARRKGSVARSVDLNSAALLLFGLLILYFGGGVVATRLSEVARATFSHASHVELNIANVHHLVREGILAFSVTVIPMLSGLMLVGVVVSIAQVGVYWTFEPLQPKFSKLNPFTGIKRVMLSQHAFIELVKGLFKVLIVTVVAYAATNDILAESLVLADSNASTILEFMAKASVAIGWKVGLAYFVLSAGDYVYQRFEYEKQLRMTKQEVKDEAKESEGDPLIKGRIKAAQRQIAYRRMMQDVPKADVVVTNPTHYAVAIKYEMGRMNAPKVVAKGADLVAQRIKEIAQEHNVPIIEDKPLAQMLFRVVEIGEEIPEKLFHAVAQVLAYVYRLRDQRKSSIA